MNSGCTSQTERQNSQNCVSSANKNISSSKKRLCFQKNEEASYFFIGVLSPFSSLFIALCTPRHPVYTRDKKEGGEQQLAIIYFRAKSLPSLTHGDSWTLCHTTLKNLD